MAVQIGYFAPLPPARSGVAAYAAELLRALRTLTRVRVNDPQMDVSLYQIGNNHLHREIYRMALERPGVTLLHDAVLHHFLLGTLSREEYIDEFVYNYAEWMRSRAEQLWAGRGSSGADPVYFSYPMLKRLVDQSKAVVVHNPRAAELVRQARANAQVVELPHLFTAPPPVDELAVTQLRQRWGVSAGDLLVGVLGHLRESKRVMPCLRAVRAARAAGARVHLLVAGEPASADLKRLLEMEPTEPWLIRKPYLPEAHFWRHAAALDVCLNLRWPSAGETSGIVVRLMGIGKAVAVTDGPEVSRYPEDTCLRVPADADEEATLTEWLLWLAARPERAREIGRAAQENIRQHHDPALVARQLLDTVELCRKL